MKTVIALAVIAATSFTASAASYRDNVNAAEASAATLSGLQHTTQSQHIGPNGQKNLGMQMALADARQAYTDSQKAPQAIAAVQQQTPTAISPQRAPQTLQQTPNAVPQVQQTAPATMQQTPSLAVQQTPSMVPALAVQQTPAKSVAAMGSINVSVSSLAPTTAVSVTINGVTQVTTAAALAVTNPTLQVAVPHIEALISSPRGNAHDKAGQHNGNGHSNRGGDNAHSHAFGGHGYGHDNSRSEGFGGHSHFH